MINFIKKLFKFKKKSIEEKQWMLLEQPVERRIPSIPTVSMHYGHYTQEELKPFVGRILSFYGWNDMPPISGRLTYENNKYYLPFSGKVNAETVLVCLKPFGSKL
jgi:hypothetical protein